jgi:hypothetical protein
MFIGFYSEEITLAVTVLFWQTEPRVCIVEEIVA